MHKINEMTPGFHNVRTSLNIQYHPGNEKDTVNNSLMLLGLRLTNTPGNGDEGTYYVSFLKAHEHWLLDNCTKVVNTTTVVFSSLKVTAFKAKILKYARLLLLINAEKIPFTVIESPNGKKIHDGVVVFLAKLLSCINEKLTEKKANASIVSGVDILNLLLAETSRYIVADNRYDVSIMPLNYIVKQLSSEYPNSNIDYNDVITEELYHAITVTFFDEVFPAGSSTFEPLKPI